MYDCEGVISNDPKINRIYDKYVQEQMIRALDNATEYQDIVDKLKAGQPLLSNQIETLKDSLEDYFSEGFGRDQIQHVMKELYFIISSDDTYIPNLMEESLQAINLVLYGNGLLVKHNRNMGNDNRTLQNLLLHR